MPDPEYVHIKMMDIPDEFIEEYTSLAATVMAGCILRFAKDAMGSHSRVSLLIICFVHTWSQKDSMSLSLHQASGVTNGDPYSSASLWMILVSNMLGLNTSTTSLIFSRSTTECN